MPFGGANPQHGVAPAKQAWAWCWCYCCGRKLELFESTVVTRAMAQYNCCGRVWLQHEAQPRPRYEAAVSAYEELLPHAISALTLLERWPGRRPHGLKATVAALRKALAPKVT